MKIILALVLLNIGAYADCISEFERSLERRQDKQTAFYYIGFGVGGLVAVSAADSDKPQIPLAIGLAGISSFLFSYVPIERTKNLINAVEEAQDYSGDSDLPANLNKLVRKLRRSSKGKIMTNDEIIEAIISANHSGLLCYSRSIDEFSKEISASITGNYKFTGEI